MAFQRRALFIFLCAMKLSTVAYIAVLNRSYLVEKFGNHTNEVLSSFSELEAGACECGSRQLRNKTELRVISYSLYGDTENENIKKRYFKQVASRAREIQQLYKGRAK